MQTFAEQIVQRLGRGRRRQACRADVGNTVSLGIGPPRTRIINQISAQAIGRSQTRTLAQQNDGSFGAEQVADLVFDRHAAVHHHDQRRQFPTLVTNKRQQCRQQRRRLTFGGRGGKTIGNDDRDIDGEA